MGKDFTTRLASGYVFGVVRVDDSFYDRPTASLLKLSKDRPSAYSLYTRAYTQKLIHIYQSRHAFLSD